MSNTELVTVALPQSAILPSTVVEDHERTSQRPQDEERDPWNGRRREQELAPVDGGPAAWRLLCAAFMFEALLWGFPLSFGVFQEYYSRIPEFSGNRYISVVGTIASGLGYLGAPLIMPFIQRYQRWQRQMIWVGWSICIAGLVLGSFASTLEVLILTQGVAYGVGFLIFYYPILSMVNEYWIARRGMAYGVLCGASGVSGSVTPFVLQALLAKYGYRTTLRAVAVALTLLTGPFIPLLNGLLIFFAMVYGFFGSGFTAIWARMSTAITDDVTATPIVFTLLNFGKGK
ncbi:hypothetical protein INS49_007678 [Diaporthe citri]|uniref:uncharacterized protein n=1 Tax=Diaporthe citri TaxID=83186 RepID=UPI001C7E9FC1|nr:uncharacterized protein INS49_007678 [Diaporthe citri]KAG6362586.1 hypothetical protein INS49_007678 [Diaporthe citri]